jgi:hypothetical protein
VARLARAGGPVVTLERARKLAETLDLKTEHELTQLRLDPPRKVLTQIRAYLLRRSEEMKTKNNPIQLLKFFEENNFAQIDLGPSIDKGPAAGHFHFDSGARLSFGLTLREANGESQVLAFRYHYKFTDGHAPQYLRFDLNEAPHTDPLVEPRCHLHPGIDDVRIPFSVHNPIEILDRIFFVLERAT